MKKSFILLSSVMSITLSSFSAISASDNEPIHEDGNVVLGSNNRVAASAQDLAKIKRHIAGYADKMGVPSKVKDVGQGTLCSCLRTSYNEAERFLLNKLAGQMLTRFLAIAMDDFADGKLDGVANGQKVSYAKEVGELLGVSVSEEDLKSEPLEEPLVVRLTSFALELGKIIASNADDKDELVSSLGAFAEKKMFRARKYLAAALIKEADRIIALELGNGQIDGLDVNGEAINWKKEMKTSVERAMSKVLDGVM